uniref:Homeobox domain-containing protein n=1 Tax=Rattus norvegicus TaxID=10116 RepID=A0ABK0LK71_RAT
SERVNLLQKVQSPHMPKGSFLHSKFQMSWTPSFSVNSGLQSTLRPMMGSGEHGDQRTSKVTSRTERKVRITYTEKQKRMLQDHFNNCRYPTQKDRMALASRVGVTHNDIQIYFKNRRARERQKKKCQQPPGKIGSGRHSRPTYPKAGEVPLSATSTDSVFQSHMDVSCPPQFRPSKNSPHQESKLFLIDKPLEEGCFSKSHVTQEQKYTEVPLPCARSGLPSVLSPLDVSASDDSMCERPSGLNSPHLLELSNITHNAESTFSVCQTPSVVRPLPELSPSSNSIDQMAIFSSIDQACEIYLRNTRSRKPRKQRKKDSSAKLPSLQGTVFLLISVFEDISSDRHYALSSHSPWSSSSSSSSPDSESIFSNGS